MKRRFSLIYVIEVVKTYSYSKSSKSGFELKYSHASTYSGFQLSIVKNILRAKPSETYGMLNSSTCFFHKFLHMSGAVNF